MTGNEAKVGKVYSLPAITSCLNSLPAYMSVSGSLALVQPIQPWPYQFLMVEEK